MPEKDGGAATRKHGLDPVLASHAPEIAGGSRLALPCGGHARSGESVRELLQERRFG